MPDNHDKRQQMLRKLSRGLIYSTPLLLAAASYNQAFGDDGRVQERYQIASAQEAKGEAESKGKAEAKGEAESKSKAEAKGEAESKGEAEAEAKADKKLVVRPRRTKAFKGDKAALAARGKELYDDASLSTNGLSCNSCHSDMAAYNDTFKVPYPHFVQMGKDMFGLKKVTTENMVQICMVSPMEAKPLAWDSEELAALSAYVDELQKDFSKQ